MSSQIIKTVGELREALADFPQNAHVGLYIPATEDGGLWVSNVKMQRRDDPESLEYHKSDNPVGNWAGEGKPGEGGVRGLNQMVTICGGDFWPDSVVTP